MVVVGDDRIFLDFRDNSFIREYWADYTETGVPKVLRRMGSKHLSSGAYTGSELHSADGLHLPACAAFCL
jgi:hypothetical protein